ncbi:hypothetical protein SAMN05216223_1198 [Actinacidiphila yanglinensis]|uniref:EamA/RhaT family transporter n=1 Tax=Actinacidiphila yanglinensis TaxID=310779 RepID=A0A1H6DTZ1_9ACTN|nr:hypothetical protein [Actinacidiphila yanglinensis]SEG88176.1 hypothetical protein SAMN05216223_1198 [Actinacidiphila yanglinensis]
MSESHAPGPDRDIPAGEPQPEPIRFFGTSWVRHDGGYALRRAGVAAGALAGAVVGALVLVFGFQGLTTADVGVFVNVLAIAGFAVCSVLMFARTWRGYAGRRGPAAEGAGADSGTSMQGLYVIGFVGALLAYFVRSLYEAPGEKLLRAEYEQARERYERRRAQRTGNPAGRGAGSGTPRRRRR